MNSASSRIRQVILWSLLPTLIAFIALQLSILSATRILAMMITGIVWIVTLIALFAAPLVTRLLRQIRSHIFIFWFMSLLFFVVAVIGWQIIARILTCARLGDINYDMVPCFNNIDVVFNFIQSLVATNVSPALEFLYLAFVIWIFIFVSGFGLTAEELRHNGQKLAHNRLTNVFITATILVFSILSLELATRYVLDMSHANAYTFLQQEWMIQYWNPINELGFRDHSIGEYKSDKRQKILIAGDSFTAGWGVKKIANTFAQQVAVAHADDYAVHVVAQPNFDTRAKLEALQNYPIPPDIVVISYYINDIEFADLDARARYLGSQQADHPAILRWLENTLYLPNLVGKTFLGPRSEKTYVDFLSEQYADDAAWEQEQRHLLELIQWTEAQDAQLIALIWPDLGELEKSRPLTNQVASFFEDRAIPTINLSDQFAGQTSATLVASPFDFHPNAAAHQQAAEVLSQVIAEIEVTTPS